MDYTDNELIYMIKEDERALSILIEKYEPLYRNLSFSFLQKNYNIGIDIEDLIQQCRITTCYALDSFDCNNNTKFFSYLIICLKRAINNYARVYIKNINVSYYNYEYLDRLSSGEDVFESVLENDIVKSIRNFSFSLKFLDSCILELRMNNFSYKEIAKLLDINPKKVDNSLLKTRKKMEKFLSFTF